MSALENSSQDKSGRFHSPSMKGAWQSLLRWRFDAASSAASVPVCGQPWQDGKGTARGRRAETMQVLVVLIA
jgi:hypothetical protein